MAKKRRHRRRRGMGSTLVVRQGLGKALGLKGSGLSSSVIPVAIGAGAAGLTLLGIRHFVNPADPTASETSKMLFKHASWFALGAGAVASAALYVLGGAKSAALAAVAGVGVAGVSLASDMLWKASPGLVAGLAGMGAIVPEYAGMRGMGAIVMQPALSGVTGESVSLGAINPAAFGTPGFNPG